MSRNYGAFSCILIFFLLTGLASSESFISYDALESHPRSSRSLLHHKKRCSIDFEHENYTALTSECKIRQYDPILTSDCTGMQYDPKACCSALKKFGCRFTNEINDRSTDCAEIMFYYINLHGKYPPGFFASTCREGVKGLDCQGLLPTPVFSPSRVSIFVGAQGPALPPAGEGMGREERVNALSNSGSGAQTVMLMLNCGFLVLWFMF